MNHSFNRGNNWLRCLGPALIVALCITVGFLLWNAPQSFWDKVAEMAPDEHYENGARIRTIRGQDFVVSGRGDKETLTPLQSTTQVIVVTNYLPAEVR